MEISRICFVVSSPLTAKVFLQGHLCALMRDYEIDLVCHSDGVLPLDILAEKVNVIEIQIKRHISLINDLLALWELFRLFKSKRYAGIFSVTPKAGLLALLAGFLCRTEVRIHIFTGQVWVTRKGLKRWALKSFDKLMGGLATDLLTDSPSQRDFLISEGVVDPKKIHVLAAGSICGVDLKRFQPSASVRNELRSELDIPIDAVVVLFLGRLNRDKGILDLAQACSELAIINQDLWLLVVGPDEENLHSQILNICDSMNSRTRLFDFTDKPEIFMAAADIFALPSYREGFGSSVIEAAACGVPSLCSKIYGLTDAVEDGVTGMLHEPGNLKEMQEKLVQLSEPTLRMRLGNAARERVIRQFSQSRLTDEMVAFVKTHIPR